MAGGRLLSAIRDCFNEELSIMVKFCNDVDIAKYEPVLFGELHLPWQVLASGEGGELSGTTFSASGADFVVSDVEAGDVIYLRSSDGVLDGVYEVVSVDSASQLTISVIRSDSELSAVSPPAGSDIFYRVSTFEPQVVEASFRLTEYFGIKPGNPVSDFAAEDILDASVLKRASVFLVISSVYAMVASKAEDENFWVKSLHYKRIFEQAKQRCQVCIDADGDGVGEVTLDGGSIRLSRD